MPTKSAFKTITVTELSGFYHVWLNRPNVKNAMNQEMVQELIGFFDALKQKSARAVFLRGKGSVFCAGADIKEMARLRQAHLAQTEPTTDQHSALWQMNRAIGQLLSRIQSCGAVVVCAVHGAAMGGGFGLMCAADIVVTTQEARMGMPETKLGLSPAQIAPFVLQRIGLNQAKQLALIGQMIDGKKAHQMGLADHCVANEEAMTQTCETLRVAISACAPGANADTKALLQQSLLGPTEALLDAAASRFVGALTGAEGLAGTEAFEQKKKAPWAV